MADVDKVDDKVEADKVDEVDAGAEAGAEAGAAKAGSGSAAEREAAADDAPTRSREADTFWNEVRIDPVEVALPAGLGYTLRAYRQPGQVAMSDLERDEDDFSILERSAARYSDDDDSDDDFDDEALGRAADEDERAALVGDATDRRGRRDDDEADPDAVEDDEVEDDEVEDGEADEAGSELDEDDDDEAAAVDLDEVPVFLGKGGRLYLFRSPEALVAFARSDAEHDLTQLDTWGTVRKRLTPEFVVAQDEDRYELDLVVDNLRGGPDAWDSDLLIQAGEVARDLGYALRLEPLLTALAQGSPLDDLDEALRASKAGGFGGFRARRKLKKIRTQQAAIGWRTIIGKISAVVDWRE